jgi:succinate-semialdehyde dehydrogenase / glutarate-semialdehyde dehydrogenase
MPLHSISPMTGLPIRSYPEQHPQEIKERLDAAARAYENWRRQGFAERAEPVRAAATILRGRVEELARLMAEEMGKPITQGRAEIEKCAWVCDHYAAQAEQLLAPDRVEIEFSRSYVCYQPLGIVLAVMPWNFPFWQFFRCAIPALMAGNGIALKHASNVTGCALAIAGVFRQAGFPPNLFQLLVVPSSGLGPALAHPAVRGVALTGSTAAGRALAAKAGAHLLKVVLELGGSDPYVILEDADPQSAAQVCAAARLVNSGQSCIAAKRFIVVESAREIFEGFLTDAMAQQVVGDPLDDNTLVGPLARHDLRDALDDQVKRSIQMGARCLLGGQKPPGRGGAFYPPTVLSGVQPGMPAFDEETFGPVAAVTSAVDETDAIRLANQSPFGLGAAVFAADASRGERVALQIEAGCCYINDRVRSDPRLPFGGIKQSGYGRELGLLGIREFVNAKTVVVC